MPSPHSRIAAAAFFCIAAAPAGATDLPIKRVMLTAGGVAYIEREAEVDGDAELGIDVPLDQVDDVLKSIVVYDSAGSVGSAHLPGREPLSQIFADLPFGSEALASAAALLNALQGSEIRTGGSHPLAGKLLQVVPETSRIGDAVVTRNRIAVMTPSGLQQVVLEEAESISFADAELQSRIDRALAAIAQHHAKDRRRIELTARGGGKRVLRVGYVVAAPLWKSAFRLTLPQDAAGPSAHLQGWAVLENMSGEDWTNVELTVQSGRPVSFRQALYQAYYVNRPEVPVEVAGRVLPRPDAGRLASAPAGAGFAVPAQHQDFAKRAEAKEKPAAAAPPAAVPLQLAGAADVAEAEEGEAEVAFRVPVAVSIKSGDSAIVPIVDRDFPVERLAFYQPGTAADHPLAALRLRNDGAAGLPPGIITLYQNQTTGAAYIGDARLGTLPAGEDRLLSYAVDEKTKLAREQETAMSLTKLTASRGTMRISHTSRQTIRYRLAAPANEARHLLIEEAKRPGWQLAGPATDTVSETAASYRLPAELKPGESATVALVLERVDWQQTVIAEMSSDDIVALASSTELDAATRHALDELVHRRQALADAEAAQHALAGEVQAIGSDQQRIRANLQGLGRDSGLYKRYVDKLAEQETRLEKLQTQIAAAAAQGRAAKTALDQYIDGLRL